MNNVQFQKNFSFKLAEFKISHISDQWKNIAAKNGFHAVIYNINFQNNFVSFNIELGLLYLVLSFC